jgi:hypothetical protein
MSSILDNLNTQLTDTKNLIIAKNSAILSAHNSVVSWKIEAKRLQDRYEAMGWTVSNDTKLKAKTSWDNAEAKVSLYAQTKSNKTLERNTLNNLLLSIQNNINDYLQAVEDSVAMGIPEGGSVEIAEAYVQAELDRVNLELEQAQAQAKADLENTTGKTTNRKIFIAIGVVVSLLLIWFIFKKIKKGKKK